MEQYEEDCIWVRIAVWLVSFDGLRLPAQTRKICRHGVFVEVPYGAWFPGETMEIVFPEPAAGHGRHSLSGRPLRREPDGIWIGFDTVLRSASEMLMRTGLSPLPGREERALAERRPAFPGSGALPARAPRATDLRRCAG